MEWLSYRFQLPSPNLPCRKLCEHMAPTSVPCIPPTPGERGPDSAVPTPFEAQLVPTHTGSARGQHWCWLSRAGQENRGNRWGSQRLHVEEIREAGLGSKPSLTQCVTSRSYRTSVSLTLLAYNVEKDATHLPEPP